MPERALSTGAVNGRRVAEMEAVLTRLAPDAAIPLVVYVHGCAGFDDDLETWARALTSAGYALVAPDSFARAGRRSHCDGVTVYPPRDLGVLALRESEIRYAIEQARRLRWARQDAVFLLGFDQGGVVVAGYRGPPVTAYVVTGWTCTSPDVQRGLFTPPDRPVLAIRWADDPLFGDPAWNGDCGAHLAPRPASRSIILEGRGHSVATDAQAREAVLKFLQRQLLR